MSYADVAAKGPKQSDAEVSTVVPAAIPEIEHSESGVQSLDSFSISSSANSIPSYADQQLEAERNESARLAGQREADEAAIMAREFEQHAEEELARLEGEAGHKYDKFSAEAKQSYEKWKKTAARDFEKLKKEAGREGKQVKKHAKEAERWAEKNKENPVVVGNVVAIAALGGLLGFGAYRLHQQNKLTANVVGLWAGVVGLFAVGDYYFSQFLFKKYPPKN